MKLLVANDEVVLTNEYNKVKTESSKKHLKMSHVQLRVWIRGVGVLNVGIARRVSGRPQQKETPPAGGKGGTILQPFVLGPGPGPSMSKSTGTQGSTST